ncbi:Ficolin-1 [Bulinus truncatus]|nr:Ficolin-1 [Bulinus truncatus]
MEFIKLRDLFIRIFLIVIIVKSLAAKHQNVHFQCPLKQDQCRNINSDKDRVVTLLDDGLQVMCDTKTDGGGWIIFQRRINGNVNFYRGWEEYKYGFGDYDVGEFYLGNEYLHRLTSRGSYELRVEFTYQGRFYYASYSEFRIQDEKNKYRIECSGYSGNASDRLAYHNGMKFTTYDSDNDLDNDINCAVQYSGAWWYRDCYHSNLNGVWNSKGHHVKGIHWNTITTSNSAQSTDMKFRKNTSS